MTRIRTIKPDFFRHRGLWDSEQETGLPLRIAFEGLWVVADREGRFRWKPTEIKLDVMPYDDVDFSVIMDALVERGFIGRYEVDGKEYGFIPSWHDHQRVNKRESMSTFPDPVHARACTCMPMRARGEGKGREEEGNGKGRECEPREIEGPDVLTDWYREHQRETCRLVMPSDADRAAAIDLEERYLAPDLERAVVEYWDNWRAYWFAVHKGDRNKPSTQRRPVHLFASFARNIEELLAGQPSVEIADAVEVEW